MKHVQPIFFLILFKICTAVCYGQEKYSKVKVYYPASDIQTRNTAIGLLDIDHFHEEEGAIISEVSAALLPSLKARNIKYDILVDDVVENLKRINREYDSLQAKKVISSDSRVAMEQPGSTVNNIIVTPTAFELKAGFGGYYTFPEMETVMNTLVATYPAIASKTSIGTTNGGNNIWVIKISDNVASDEANEPEVLYLGLQHAREAITGASMIFFMQYLCERYGQDTRIKDLIDNREIYIIPCFNPDGWIHNTSLGVGGMWRKNRRPTGGGAANIGVDLNRNWSVDWGNCPGDINNGSNSCGTTVKDRDTYIGPSAFSEAETQAVRAFVQSKHIIAGFDQHAFGPYYSLPFGRKGLHVMPVKGQNFYKAIPAKMGKYNGMRAADSFDALGYEVAGGFKDYMLMGDIGTGFKDTVWAMTGEGGAGGGTSGNDFWAPKPQIIQLCKGMCYQNVQLAFAAGSYVEIQDLNDIGLTSLSGTLNFNAKRLGLGDQPVTVTLVPIENMKTVGAPVTISSMPYYHDYNASIGYTLHGVDNGQRVKYAWRVSTAGYTYSDTITKFYNPVTLLYDDMEGALVTTNWTVAGGWNYSTDSKYAGSKALTESPGGNYAASSTRTATYRFTFNLTDATASYLTFWTKHRAENGRDKLQVQVSTDGTVWVPVAGVTTIKEPNDLDGSTISNNSSLTGILDYWVQEKFDLSAYNGTANLRLRFVFTSGSDPSATFIYARDDGFYIDNLRMIKSTASLATLAVKFINVNARMLNNNSVLINWEAETDSQHGFFEVERSKDGVHYSSIGKVIGKPPYQLVDNSSNNGYVYYRIKQLDKDGKTSYSKIVNVFIRSGKYNLIVHPNPVADKVNLQMNGLTNDAVNVQISDMHGREVYNEIFTGSAQKNISISVQTWRPQMYFVKIYSKNRIIATQKFVKQ